MVDLNKHDRDYTPMAVLPQADFYALRPCNQRLRMIRVSTGPEIA
jgi:hypothetical protein